MFIKEKHIRDEFSISVSMPPWGPSALPTLSIVTPLYPFYCIPLYLCVPVILSPSCKLFILPSSPLVMTPFVFLHSATVLLMQPLIFWVFGPMIGPGPRPPPLPPSGYSGVLGGVRRQDGSGFPVREWWMLPFRLRLCVCDWPEGLSRPLSSTVSDVISSLGPLKWGLLWVGGKSSLCISIGQKDFKDRMRSKVPHSKSKIDYSGFNLSCMIMVQLKERHLLFKIFVSYLFHVLVYMYIQGCSNTGDYGLVSRSC